ncbi:MAG: hypothetical protein AAB353_14555 [Candidatus Hydrogenedentota bacterium]
MEILPSEIIDELNSRVESGTYASLAELIQEALKALDLIREANDWVEDKIREGFESGPAEEMTDEDWDDIEREGLARIQGRSIE